MTTTAQAFNSSSKFTSLWFSKDILQSTLIVWCLVLALVLGSQSLFFDTRKGIVNVAGCCRPPNTKYSHLASSLQILFHASV